MPDADRLTFTLSSGGDVVIKLRPDLAPGHVARITDLARDGFYDGVKFHRVLAGVAMVTGVACSAVALVCATVPEPPSPPCAST